MRLLLQILQTADKCQWRLKQNRCDQKYHNTARHKFCPVKQNLNQGTDESSRPESIKIVHVFPPSIYIISGTLYCSITTACAIPGIESPSLKLTFDNNAPVGTNRIRFQLLFMIPGNICPAKTEAAHPHPLPPECDVLTF